MTRLIKFFLGKKEISQVKEDPVWVLVRFLRRLGIKAEIPQKSYKLCPINVLGKLEVEEL